MSQEYEAGTFKWKRRKTIKLGSPKEAGDSLTCPHCKTVFMSGSRKQDTYECPFCFREVEA